MSNKGAETHEKDKASVKGHRETMAQEKFQNGMSWKEKREVVWMHKMEWSLRVAEIKILEGRGLELHFKCLWAPATYAVAQGEEHLHHLGFGWRCRIVGPSQTLLNQNLHFNKILRLHRCTVKCDNYWYGHEWWWQCGGATEWKVTQCFWLFSEKRERRTDSERRCPPHRNPAPFMHSLTNAFHEAAVIVIFLLLHKGSHQGFQEGTCQQCVWNQLWNPNHHFVLLRGNHVFSDSSGQIVVVSLP